MSALPQSDPSPRKRIRRAKRFYSGKTAKEVQANFRDDKWTGRALTPELFFVSSGACQAGLLWAIFQHTEGKPHLKSNRHWTAPEWTPQLWPQDFACELRFTRSSIIEAIDDALDRGLIARKAETGPERYCYKLLCEAWIEEAERIQRENKAAASVDDIERKPPQSEGIDDEEEDGDGGGQQEQPLLAAVPPRTRVPAGSTVRWEHRHDGARVSFPVCNQLRTDVSISSAMVDGQEALVIAEQGHRDRTKNSHTKNGKCSKNDTSASKTVGIPTVETPNGTQKHTPWKFDIAKFPLSTDSVNRQFSRTDQGWLATQFDRGIRIALDKGVDPKLVTDVVLLNRLRACTVKNQFSAGLYESKLPLEFAAWADEILAGRDPDAVTATPPSRPETDASRLARERLERKMRLRNG